MCSKELASDVDFNTATGDYRKIARVNAAVPLPTMTETTGSIVTPYNCSYARALEEIKLTTIVESIDRYNLETLFFSVVAILILSKAINMHLKMNRYVSRGPSGSGTTTVLSFLLKNPYAKKINATSRIIHTVLAVIAFLTGVTYFVNCFRSEWVNVYVPQVFTNFEDVAQDEQVVIAVENMAYVEGDGPRVDYTMAQISKKYEAKGMKQSGQPKFFGWLLDENADHKVFLTSNYPIAGKLCILRDHYGGISETWFSRGVCFYEHKPGSEDFADSHYLEMFINRQITHAVSEKFTKEPIHRKYRTFYLRANQMGLMHSDQRGAESRTPATEECTPKYPITYRRWTSTFGIKYYKYALFSLLIPLVAACIVLIYENIFIFMKTGNKNKVVPSIEENDVETPTIPSVDVAPNQSVRAVSANILFVRTGVRHNRFSF